MIICDGGHLTLHALLWAKRNFRTRLNLNFRFARQPPRIDASAKITSNNQTYRD
jgi:hypothetical protein